MAVLPTPASPTKTGPFFRRRHKHFERALQLLLPSDQRVEQPCGGALRQVHAVGGQRVARDRRRLVVTCGHRLALARVWLVGQRVGHLADAVGDEVEDVEPGDALGEQCLRRKRARLLERGRQHVSGAHFAAARALHVQHGRLQHATERDGLRRVFLPAARELLDLVGQVRVERLAQLGQVGAARAENGFAVGVVRQRVEQVLERQVRVSPRGCFAVGDGQNDFKCLAEHSSLFHRGLQGIARLLRQVTTVATFVSATSCV